VARRLLAVNLSDLAAMGAAPAYALLALSAPAGFDHRRFLRAFTGAARRAGVALAGGDLARAPQLVATLTLLGRRRPRGRWLRRTAARPGDVLYAGGTLGESALGRLLLVRGAVWRGGRVDLPHSFTVDPTVARAAGRAVRRHLLPQPQLALSAALARHRRCACIDVSDGLARDLGRLTAESGVGATIDLSALPLSPHAPRLAAALAADPHDLALAGGEDYVLLFALPASAHPPPGSVPIGRIDQRMGMRLRRGARVGRLPAIGWDHLGSPAEGEAIAADGRRLHAARERRAPPIAGIRPAGPTSRRPPRR
jgi:thiamine-monophosphate kinase